MNNTPEVPDLKGISKIWKLTLEQVNKISKRIHDLLDKGDYAGATILFLIIVIIIIVSFGTMSIFLLEESHRFYIILIIIFMVFFLALMAILFVRPLLATDQHLSEGHKNRNDSIRPKPIA